MLCECVTPVHDDFKHISKDKLRQPRLYLCNKQMAASAGWPRSTPGYSEISAPLRQHFYPQPRLTLLPGALPLLSMPPSLSLLDLQA